MAAARVITRTAQPPLKSAPRKKRAPAPVIPMDLSSVDADTFPPAWATDITRYSTISGAHSLTLKELQALRDVPRDGPLEDASGSARVTRTRSGISLGQRIDFAFQSGSKHLAGKGMPVYVLATNSETELVRHMHAARDTVMQQFGMKRVRIRIQWPFPRDGGFDRLTFEEWVNVDASTTRLQVAMLAAGLFRQFFEKYRMSLASLPDYAWLLRPDAFYRVWLVGLERVENNVFAAELLYVKDHPRQLV